MPGAKAGDSKWEVKTPLNFTAACYCDQLCNVTRSFGKSEILVVMKLVAYLYIFWETVVGGQFGWGGTLLKWYQQGPKVGSVGLEIRRRV